MDGGTDEHDTDKPCDAFTRAHWSGRDLALTLFQAPPGQSSVGALARVLLGRALHPMEWAQGVEYIATDAAGGPGSTFVGYRVCPRLGFDGPIPPAARAKLDALPAGHPLRVAHTVRQLLARPGGRAWWETNGSEFRAYFELTEDSVSRRLLAAYTREKAIII